jgi:hypothetical protein
MPPPRRRSNTAREATSRRQSATTSRRARQAVAFSPRRGQQRGLAPGRSGSSPPRARERVLAEEDRRQLHRCPGGTRPRPRPALSPSPSHTSRRSTSSAPCSSCRPRLFAEHRLAGVEAARHVAVLRAASQQEDHLAPPRSRRARRTAAALRRRAAGSPRRIGANMTSRRRRGKAVRPCASVPAMLGEVCLGAARQATTPACRRTRRAQRTRLRADHAEHRAAVRGWAAAGAAASATIDVRAWCRRRPAS